MFLLCLHYGFCWRPYPLPSMQTPHLNPHLNPPVQPPNSSGLGWASRLRLVAPRGLAVLLVRSGLVWSGSTLRFLLAFLKYVHAVDTKFSQLFSAHSLFLLFYASSPRIVTTVEISIPPAQRTRAHFVSLFVVFEYTLYTTLYLHVWCMMNVYLGWRNQ